MKNSLIQALLAQGNDAKEAQEIFEYLRGLMYESPDEVEEALHDEGLEPDYLIDLLTF
jgi:hypothetical protein